MELIFIQRLNHLPNNQEDQFNVITLKLLKMFSMSAKKYHHLILILSFKLRFLGQ